MEQKSNKTIQERLTKINKDRRMLMMLLHKLKKQIEEARSRIPKMKENESLEEFEKWLFDENHFVIDELLKRRKDYRKRLTKLTNKRHDIHAQQRAER